MAMSEALQGAIVGGAIGIAGALVATLLASELTRRQWRRDHEIRQIQNTVRILDAWEELAVALLGGAIGEEATGELSEWHRRRITAAEANLRETDRIWDWTFSVIPGDDARQLHQLCLDVSAGRSRSRRERHSETMSRLVELQGKVREAAPERVRELS